MFRYDMICSPFSLFSRSNIKSFQLNKSHPLHEHAKSRGRIYIPLNTPQIY